MSFEFSDDDPASRDAKRARRRYRRWLVDLPAYLEAGGTTRYCLIHDIAPAGARLRVVGGGTLEPGTEVVLDLEDYGRIPARARHNAHESIGLQFLHDAAGEAKLRAWLLEARPPRRQHRHKCHLPAVLVTQSGDVACIVTDLSRAGAAAQVESTEHLQLADEVELILPDCEPIAASVRRIEDHKVGLLLIDGFQGELPPRG